jgi:sialate O-acetylesterase
MADFKVAAVFSSNMVLQRDKNIKVFGQGVNGAAVKVTFDGKTWQTAVKEEQWTVILPPKAAGTGFMMAVSCGDQVKCFENIAIGEVWLAGGQSNMEYELQNCKGGLEVLQNDENPNVRFYYTNKISYMDDYFYEMEEKTGWTEFSEENAKTWSAVGYYFGRKLAKELGVTVGIIGCNWGGTSASCWTSRESLAEDADLNIYLEEYDQESRGKSEEEQIREYKEYEAYHTEWDKKCNELYAVNPDMEWDEVQKILGVCRWPGPKNCMSPYRPSGLYQCMLQRIIPYTLRGFIYYQGEEDDKKPLIYQKLLTRMIRQWREDWEDITLPFLLVQLPMHRYKQDEDTKSWCLIREAQMRTYQTVKNTGIAVILDCGEFNEIHPKDKLPVGERLGLQAFHHVYKRLGGGEAFGPLYQAFEYKDGGIELSFDYAEDGFDCKGEAGGFEIAGEDMVYYKAEPEFRGSRIFLSAKEVAGPVYARYCWTNYSEVTIFGKNGLPLAPFRTTYGKLK